MPDINYITYGRQRDVRIVRVIEESGAITRSQVQTLVGINKKSGTRIIQNRLHRLHEMSMIKKLNRYSYEPPIYYVTKPKHIDHCLGINDIICAFVAQKPPLYRLEYEWSYKILGGKIWADAMIKIYTDPDRKNAQVVFVEYERSPSKRFNKVEQYTRAFKENWRGEEWAITKNGIAYFPTVLIVTDEFLKLETTKPRFLVMTTEQIRQNLYPQLIRKELM